MCWLSNNKPAIKVAEENIPIFKICMKMLSKEDCVQSYYWEFVYHLNREYDIFEEDGVNALDYCQLLDNRYRIDVGFHSYGINVILRVNNNGDTMFVETPRIVIDSYYKTKKVIRVNGYIPKGANYVTNEQGEYVSNKIVLTDIQEIK